MGAFSDLIGPAGGAFFGGASTAMIEDVKRQRELAAQINAFKALAPLQMEQKRQEMLLGQQLADEAFKRQLGQVGLLAPNLFGAIGTTPTTPPAQATPPAQPASPDPSPLNPEGKGVRLAPEFMNLEKVAPTTAAAIAPQPENRLAVSFTPGSKTPFRFTTRPAGGQEPTGEFSRATRRAEEAASRFGLTGDERDGFIQGYMERYRGGMAYTTGQQGTVGRNVGPALQAQGNAAFLRGYQSAMGRTEAELAEPGAPPPPAPGSQVPTPAGGPPATTAPLAPTGMSSAQRKAYESKRGSERAETTQQTVQDNIKSGLNVVRLLDDLERDPGLNAYSYSGRRFAEEGRDFLSGVTAGTISPNQDYVRFRQKLRTAALQAFDFGGKQLTETEKSFVLATVPSGVERTPQEMRSKITELNKRIRFITNVQARLASLPREQYGAAVEQEIAKYGTGGGTAGPSAPGGGWSIKRRGQ